MSTPVNKILIGAGFVVAIAAISMFAFKSNSPSTKATSASTTTTASPTQAANTTKIAPLTNFSQSISVGKDALTKLQTGQSVTIPVKVTNSGIQTWITDQGKKLKPIDAVRLSFHWLKDNKVIVEGGRTPFAKDIAPGQSETLNTVIKAPATAGHYVLQLSLIQEGVAWFNKSGGKALDIPVDVVAKP